MTGIPTVNDLISTVYFWLAWGWTAGFAWYDVKTRRVPDRALFVFCAYAFWAPFFWLPGLPEAEIEAVWAFGSALMGAAAGFLLMLSAALLSKDGTGIGGGDIKLTAVLGYVYGPYRLAGLLLAAALSAALWAFLFRKQKTIPFVPVMAAGSFFVMCVST